MKVFTKKDRSGEKLYIFYSVKKYWKKYDEKYVVITTYLRKN